MGEIAGVNTASLGVYLHSTKTRARWAEGFHQLNGHVFDLERDGLRHVVLAQDSPCDDNTQPFHTGSVAARSTRTAPSAAHQDGGVKCATGASSRIRGRDITIGTWNTRTLRAAGKTSLHRFRLQSTDSGIDHCSDSVSSPPLHGVTIGLITSSIRRSGLDECTDSVSSLDDCTNYVFSPPIQGCINVLIPSPGWY